MVGNTPIRDRSFDERQELDQIYDRFQRYKIEREEVTKENARLIAEIQQLTNKAEITALELSNSHEAYKHLKAAGRKSEEQITELRNQLKKQDEVHSERIERFKETNQTLIQVIKSLTSPDAYDYPSFYLSGAPCAVKEEPKLDSILPSRGVSTIQSSGLRKKGKGKEPVFKKRKKSFDDDDYVDQTSTASSLQDETDYYGLDDLSHTEGSPETPNSAKRKYGEMSSPRRGKKSQHK